VVDGYHADAAVTVGVGEIDPAARRLLETTERALWAGIEQARVGNRLVDISHAVGQVAHAAGYGILADHGGHGVGQLLHEDPSVDNDGRPGRGPRLRDGLVLAIEPMFVDGDAGLRPPPRRLGRGHPRRLPGGPLRAHRGRARRGTGAADRPLTRRLR
jgi:methionine aminopeptidase